jgi:arylsulfatase
MQPGLPRERQRWGTSLLITLVLVILPVALHAGEAGSSLSGSRPNIILIMTDDQGYGEMSCHGNPILRTPNLDRLHREGARFTDFTVSPTCAPTRAALYTGRHEFRSGVTHTIYERERLSLSAITIAQVLRSAGYSTGIFGKWHLGDERTRRPDRRGFDEVFIHGAGGIGQTYPGSCGDAPGNAYFDPVVLHNGRFVKTQGYCTDVFFRQGLDWISGKKGRRQPFFACITPNAPHAPCISPGPEYDRFFQDKGLNTNQVAYYSMIRNIDDNVGRLLDRLTDWKFEENTLVIFLTDNGHSFGNLYNAGMRAAKGTPYQGGIRVPSFWRWPGRITPGDREQVAAHIDVFPTLAELAGARVRARVSERLEGFSLVPCLADAGAPWRERTLFTHVGRWPSGRSMEWQHRGSAVRRGDFKLVNGSELYHLRKDPTESRNIAAEHPGVVAELNELCNRWWNDVLPAALESEEKVGPAINPFKALYWRQHGGNPDADLLKVMDPAGKFTTRK